MGRPKQFIELLGSPALLYALRAFQDAPGVDRIYTVGDRIRIENIVAGAGITKYTGCAAPGETRSLSTKNGLGLCDEDEDTIVLVQDGSRCLLTPELVQRVIEAAREGHDGVVPALPVSDTIKVAHGGSVVETLDRSKLHAVQTPQAFRLGLLRDIYAVTEDELRLATDDASLVERKGGRVTLVHGERTNIKLTSPEDIILAEAILMSRSVSRNGLRR
jgi:2-C-methyl-D-erythritol 4-phosphate cytidylyltransferase